MGAERSSRVCKTAVIVTAMIAEKDAEKACFVRYVRGESVLSPDKIAKLGFSGDLQQCRLAPQTFQPPFPAIDQEAGSTGPCTACGPGVPNEELGRPPPALFPCLHARTELLQSVRA